MTTWMRWLKNTAIGFKKSFSEQEELGFAVYLCSQKQKIITVNRYRWTTKAFILAKEIAYNYLEITERLYTFSWIKFDNFDQVLNNFYAYFAGALLIPRKQLVSELNLFWLKQILSLKKW
jgi:hypothetical protein